MNNSNNYLIHRSGEPALLLLTVMIYVYKSKLMMDARQKLASLNTKSNWLLDA
jgi:hypothetical protein